MATALALAGEGYSRRKIARMLGVSRNTLKKYLSAGDGARFPPNQPGKLASYLDTLSGMIRERPATRAVDVFRRLQAAGYSGSYDLVKRKVRSLRQDRLTRKTESGPGLRARADLGKVEAGGRLVYLFTLTLEYSGRIYAELRERADLDAFLEWHERAFRYFQGVPGEIEYEKSRNRLVKAFVGGTGVNLPMSLFAAHHGFSTVTAEPFTPWSAGRLKRPLRMIEALFLKGYPLRSLEGANTALLGWLLGREATSDSGSIKDRFARESASLRPLPKSGFARFRLKLLERQET
jgi:transposase